MKDTGPSWWLKLAADEAREGKWARTGALWRSCPSHCVLAPPLSKCGTYPPESCLFSLIGNVGAFMGELCP